MLALLIALYAAHRGFKALIAGLSFIHEEEAPMGFWGFNLLAFLLYPARRPGDAEHHVRPVPGYAADGDDPANGAVTGRILVLQRVDLGLDRAGFLGLTLIYRYAMSWSKPVAWRPSILGGVVGGDLCRLAASWASAIYVTGFAHFGATYGSIAAVVVLLVWLSWTVNAIFFGGALATEVEILIEEATAYSDRGIMVGQRKRTPS